MVEPSLLLAKPLSEQVVNVLPAVKDESAQAPALLVNQEPKTSGGKMFPSRIIKIDE